MLENSSRTKKAPKSDVNTNITITLILPKEFKDTSTAPVGLLFDEMLVDSLL